MSSTRSGVLNFNTIDENVCEVNEYSSPVFLQAEVNMALPKWSSKPSTPMVLLLNGIQGAARHGREQRPFQFHLLDIVNVYHANTLCKTGV
jgi:hypothetical protein